MKLMERLIYRITKATELFILGGLIFSLAACHANMFDDVMSADDIAALQAMETAYVLAVEYNDSLATHATDTGTSKDETCLFYDGMFHQNDSIFEANHARYSHNNSGDDHCCNSWMMGMGYMNGSGMMGNAGVNNGGVMGNGFSSSNCTWNNLNLMDSLMEAHEEYHPGN